MLNTPLVISFILNSLKLEVLSRLGIVMVLWLLFRDSFSSVESVKAASDAFSPATGKVLEVNTVLLLFFIKTRLFLRLLLL